MRKQYHNGVTTQAQNTIPVFAEAKAGEYHSGMGSRLRIAREAKGLSQVQLAKLAKTSQPQVDRLEKDERELTVPWARRFAPHLDVSIETLLDLATTVRIVGYVGAGAQAHFLDSGDLGEAPRPPGFSPEGVALSVRGDSMPGIAEDQWLIYYEDRRDPPTDDMIGELCVVQILDGPVLVKRLYRGGTDATFDLVSTSANYEPMRNVELEWAAKVEWIRPR